MTQRRAYRWPQPLAGQQERIWYGGDGNRAKSCKINIYNTSFERVYLTVYFCLKVIPEKIARSTDHNNISSALITALVSFKVGFHKF